MHISRVLHSFLRKSIIIIQTIVCVYHSSKQKWSFLNKMFSSAHNSNYHIGAFILNKENELYYAIELISIYFQFCHKNIKNIYTQN